MSFLRRRKSKVKSIRSDSKLDFQRGMDASREDREKIGETSTLPRKRPKLTLKEKIARLEERLNTAETRSSPPQHISVIRNLAKGYMKLGVKEDAAYYVKAENLYKQFSVLYPLHMEKIDWIAWIEVSAKARLIREARNLLAEARLLFPGDDDLDTVETNVLHIDHTKLDESA
ncbi:MAG: hypothetical protein ACW97Z_03780 [Candidatus Hodarchaeales archaeon]